MDKSWMGTNRTRKPYIEGVAAFVDYAIKNLLKTSNEMIEMPCPCTKCLNHVQCSVELVGYHLFRYGIDLNYKIWTKHGEKDEKADKPIDATKEFVDNPVFDSDIPTDGPQTVEMVNAAKDYSDEDDHEKFQELLLDAEKPLYERCPDFTKLSAIVQLLNLKSKHGCSDKFFTELLVLLKKMLPEGNEMVENTYEAKKIMKQMGSGYEKIHVCINNCLLYWKEDEKLTVCRTCGTSRWKVDRKTKKVYENIPAKVMWYFPIIPRLQRLFRIQTISEDLRWHATRRIIDGVLRHPADSQAWHIIDEKFPEMAKDPRTLRLGISADGVDVNRGNRQHSVWPVLTVIYNLHPWLCMKRKFILLSVLISGYPGNDIDVFLQPFVDDLQILFEKGVDTYDAYSKDNFKLQAVVLWTINDYPALGTLCGCPCSGYKGCVVCGKDTYCVRLPASSKMSYIGHRRYLPYTHAFRKQRKAFNGQQEFGSAPLPKTGEEIYNEVQHVENKWGKGKQTKNMASENQEDARGRGGKIQKKKRKRTKQEDSSSQANEQNDAYWKKFNIWYQKLRYWRHNPVQHCLDFMHIEKNVGESLIGTLLNIPGKTKDGVNARLDLQELGIKPELYAKIEEDKTLLPAAGYTLTNAEKDIFCETLYNIRVPQGYCSNISSLVSLNDRKLIGLKSHDYHMLMQEFLPIAVRTIMHPHTRYAIIRFCFFFKSICSKEIILEDLDKMQEELCVTMCLLEKFFPPSFFDIMVHLTVHLTREVKLCGPVCFRWMYPFERCMKVIKGHVRNRTRPEGCIAEETIAEETIEFCSEYQKSMKTIGIPHDEYETGENDEGKPQSSGKSCEVPAELLQKTHLYVIQNIEDLVPYIERHKHVLETENPDKRKAFLENEHSKSFAKWLEEEVTRELAISNESVSKTVRWISFGPRATVVKYDAYNINGYLFRTKSREGAIYQNSGVSVESIDLHISKEVATTKQTFYYGVLQEIWVLDYRVRQIPLFKCDWVNHRAGGVKRDGVVGYTLVDLNNLGHKGDPFILASQAGQVFYVKDPLHKKFSIVFRTPSKKYKDTYDENDEEFSTVIHPHNDCILPRVDIRDLGNELQDDYYRTNSGDTVI